MNKDKETNKQCHKCGSDQVDGEHVYDFGWTCQDCLDQCENQTGYCSMSCQLGYGCDGSC